MTGQADKSMLDGVPPLDEAEFRRQVEEFCARYPMRRSALMPALHLAQQYQGYLTAEGMSLVAEILGLSPTQVYEVASFYDHFHTRPIGRCRLQFCTNISCLLAGGESLLTAAAQRLRLAPGQTSEDRSFTLDRVECLGACDMAPVVQLNNQPYLERLDLQGLATLLDRLISEQGYRPEDQPAAPHQQIPVRHV